MCTHAYFELPHFYLPRWIRICRQVLGGGDCGCGACLDMQMSVDTCVRFWRLGARTFSRNHRRKHHYTPFTTLYDHTLGDEEVVAVQKSRR